MSTRSMGTIRKEFLKKDDTMVPIFHKRIYINSQK